MRLSGSNRSWPAWWSAVALALFLACTAGEAPPRPTPVPDTTAGPADPAGEQPAPEDPGVTPAEEAERAAYALLTQARLAYEAVELGEALDLSRRVMAGYPETPSAIAAALVGARAAFALGAWTEAAELAERFVAAEPGGAHAEEGRMLADMARDELAPPSDAPVRIGVILPRTGAPIMVRYADWLLQGVEVAARQAEERERRPVEIVVADDAGGSRTRDAVAELERRGVVAIIGPLLPQQLPDVAGSRTGRSLTTVSPTAPEHPIWPDVYSVNTGDARGAQELGRYAFELGLVQAAMLYPRSPEYERKASAFAVEFEAMGGEIRASVPYDSGTTTFASHIRRVLAAVAPDTLFYDSLAGPPLDSLGYPPGAAPDTFGAAFPPGRAEAVDSAAPADPWLGKPPQEPFALFVAAPDRDVRQIAPQVAFYGLDSAGVQVFGDEAWASASVRRVVPRQDLEGVIAASHFPPGRGDALADPDFVQRYEAMFRRSLENQLPALGYDAANLVLQAVPNRMVTPDALARRFRLLAGLRGATGTFSVRADRVVRTPYLVVIRGGALELAPAPWEYRLPQPRPPLPPPDTTATPDGPGRR